MSRYSWGHLNHIQVGRYGKQLVKTEFMRHGLDVRSADVDRRRTELVIRLHGGICYDVRVRTVRDHHYIYFLKDRFVLRPDLPAAVVILVEDEPPSLYLIPSKSWKEPNALLVSRDYEGKKSQPEWGINLSQKNMPLLEAYAFDWVVETLLPRTKAIQPQGQRERPKGAWL